MANIFLNIAGIKGESIDAKHKDEIEVLSFSWGLAKSATIHPALPAPPPPASVHDLVFVHGLDRASPGLMRACASSEHITEATITQRKPGGQQEFLAIKMSDLMVTSISLSEPGDGPGVESVSLAFAKIDFEYRRQKPDGSLEPPVIFKFPLP